jgi:hypothetical protein
MRATHREAALRHIHRLIGSRRVALCDHELVQFYLERRDETAFAALVERHGPMVLLTGKMRCLPLGSHPSASVIVLSWTGRIEQCPSMPVPRPAQPSSPPARRSGSGLPGKRD